MLKMEVGKTYEVTITSEMKVCFQSKLVAIIDVQRNSLPSQEYESEWHVDELHFENGVVVYEGGSTMTFEEVLGGHAPS